MDEIRFQLRINDTTDIAEHVLAVRREASICSGVTTLEVDLPSEAPLNLHPGTRLVLYEWDYNTNSYFKDKEYFVGNTSKNTETGIWTLGCQDGSKYLIDYFIDKPMETSRGKRARYWIERVLEETGMGLVWLPSHDGIEMDAVISLGMQSAYDSLTTLLQQNGWYFYINANNQVVIGSLDFSPSNYHAILTTEDILAFEVSEDDEMLRNRAVVWGGTDWNTRKQIFADDTRLTGYERSSGDRRAVVISNGSIGGQDVAEEMTKKVLDEFARITVTKTVTKSGTDGQRLDIGNGALIRHPQWTGLGMVTTAQTTISGDGYTQTLILDERCPRLFAYFKTWDWPWIDAPAYFEAEYVYVATYDRFTPGSGQGVWRKPIGAVSGWEDFSQGLESLDVTDLHIVMGVFACVAGGELYTRVLDDTAWTKVDIGPLLNEELQEMEELSREVTCCIIDQATLLVYAGVAVRPPEFIYPRSWVIEVSPTTGVSVVNLLRIQDRYDLYVTDIDRYGIDVYAVVIESVFSSVEPGDHNIEQSVNYGYNAPQTNTAQTAYEGDTYLDAQDRIRTSISPLGLGTGFGSAIYGRHFDGQYLYNVVKGRTFDEVVALSVSRRNIATGQAQFFDVVENPGFSSEGIRSVYDGEKVIYTLGTRNTFPFYRLFKFDFNNNQNEMEFTPILIPQAEYTGAPIITSPTDITPLDSPAGFKVLVKGRGQRFYNPSDGVWADLTANIHLYNQNTDTWDSYTVPFTFTHEDYLEHNVSQYINFSVGVPANGGVFYIVTETIDVFGGPTHHNTYVLFIRASDLTAHTSSSFESPITGDFPPTPFYSPDTEQLWVYGTEGSVVVSTNDLSVTTTSVTSPPGRRTNNKFIGRFIDGDNVYNPNGSLSFNLSGSFVGQTVNLDDNGRWYRFEPTQSIGGGLYEITAQWASQSANGSVTWTTNSPAQMTGDWLLVGNSLLSLGSFTGTLVYPGDPTPPFPQPSVAHVLGGFIHSPLIHVASLSTNTTARIECSKTSPLILYGDINGLPPVSGHQIRVLNEEGQFEFNTGGGSVYTLIDQVVVGDWQGRRATFASAVANEAPEFGPGPAVYDIETGEGLHFIPDPLATDMVGAIETTNNLNSPHIFWAYQGQSTQHFFQSLGGVGTRTIAASGLPEAAISKIRVDDFI